ncbi:phytoene dehydrogenase-like protein [Leptospira ellinghausenii]|uniref:Phytoene dehydrogenase-like protein n=1 Tax=Leptospira ellinghausenii TaxID=1917822 RepID=A0A2P2DFG1_9LEPT|nr:NAD(P)/FAD-dependent oxidoreductase [Leptospira ellinghausenii]GBF43363.1 phytoene dehydrogenase-like protein [Leptospira ellinghausenii]
METKFDVIIIGSGIGGLTAASILSQVANKKVLVLERHFKLGGFTHTFKRLGKFEWDVGIHYIGDLAEGSMLRTLFDSVTKRGVQWKKMEEPFEVFDYPNFSFPVYGEKERFRNDLKSKFPKEEKAIDQYFKDVETFTQWFGRHFTLKALPAFFEKAAKLLGLDHIKTPYITTKEYMDSHFQDENLRSLLCSQWGDYGLPPKDSSFAIHSMIVAHYFNGGYFPIGGSSKIVDSIEPIVEKNGGAMKILHTVKEIILDGDKAIGVKVDVQKGKTITEQSFFADEIISDAGAYTTYKKLLPKQYSEAFVSPLESLSTQGTTSITLYIGFKESPTKLGFHGENHWIFPTVDHDESYAKRNNLIHGKPPMMYLSFPSLKNPEAEGHTAEAISFADYTNFAKWKGEPWKKRGEDYNELKGTITEGMLAFLEERFPGFRDLIEFTELSTPITTEYFTGHKEGSIYGLSCTPERFRQEWLGVRTTVKNLYLTGADACSPGVAGALMGGVAASSVVLGLSGTLRLMKELFQKSQETD